MITKRLFHSIKQFAYKPTSLVDDFNKFGITLVEGPDSHVDFDYVKQTCDNILMEYKDLAKLAPGGLGLGKENGFRELVEKDVGRFDVNFDHLVGLNPTNRNLSKTEKDLQQIFSNIKSRITPVLSVVLGESFIPNAFGCVTSSPGTTAQRWHMDSSHIFTKDQTNGLVLPCHFTTVFFPLYSFAKEIGPTQVALGTQKYTNQLGNETVEEQYPPDHIVNAMLQKENVTILEVDASPGDIVIMDGRVLHRGLANQSNTMRTLMYLSFCIPSYREYPQSQNAVRSVFSR